MNIHRDIHEFASQPDAVSKKGLLARLLRFLATVLASPKGDQGGWEGGARGL
jgi:hypothetical protein